MNEALLSQVPLFISLPQDEINYLARTLRILEVQPHTLLFREAEYGDLFYIVIEGQVEIIKSLDKPDERLVNMRGPGEYVGEMSLFNRDGLRTASARTLTEVHLFEMTRADFDALLHRQPNLAYEMARVLSLRLSNADDRTVHDLREKNLQLTEAYNSLKSAQAQIIEKEKLDRELQLAYELQSSLIPRRLPHLTGWKFAACWLPARNVSGDFYDFIILQPPGKDSPECSIVIADVADKGMAAALFMAVSRSTIRASVTGLRQPGDAISQANQIICADSIRGLFVTLFYAQLDPLTGDLVYVNAGHNPPWVYRAADGRWDELKRTGLPLGIQPQTLEQRPLKLNYEDLLFLYTDGVTDSRSPEGEEFGVERLRSILEENVHSSAIEIASVLEQTLKDFCGGEPLFDDITFVVIKRDPVKSIQDGPFELSIAAEVGNLAAIRSFVQETLTNFGASARMVGDLLLAVDELVSNTINYGYRGQPEAIEISIQRDGQTVVVNLCDQAPPFDPTRVADPDITLPLDQRPVGGVGIYMARQLVDTMTYRRTEDTYNEITLTKKINLSS